MCTGRIGGKVLRKTYRGRERYAAVREGLAMAALRTDQGTSARGSPMERLNRQNDF